MGWGGRFSSSPLAAFGKGAQKFSDTDTLTLSSSVLDYQYENGRRYHAYRQGMCVFMEALIKVKCLEIC